MAIPHENRNLRGMEGAVNAASAIQCVYTGPGGAGAVEPVPIAATWQPTSLCRPKRPFQKCRSRGRLDVYK
ncbi:hypothetical protein ANTPLA_LOCUS3801 [Anthophora plagiata]